MELYNKIDFDIKKVFSGGEKLTFLVGAGISINPPSNLASARDIIDSILRFCCPEDVSKDFFENRATYNLRYEMIMQYYRSAFDPQFKIIDYFGSAKQPNLIHHFLAEMLKNGNFVLTTNFDNLIEIAMGSNNKKARVVLTKKDFEDFKDPNSGNNKDLQILYKLHGAKRNFLSGEDTGSTIISTIDALGKGKGEEVFSIEPYKREVFENICKNRTLVVMGYSGGDDFDIIPVLKNMKDLSRIIWIEHSSGVDIIATEMNYKLNNEELSKLYGTISSLDRELFLIGDSLKKSIIKIKVSTLNLIKILGYSNEKFNIGSVSEMPKPYDWIVENIPSFHEYRKIYFACNLYYLNKDLPKVKKYLDLLYAIHKPAENTKDKAIILMDSSHIENDLGNYTKALELVNEAIKIFDQLRIEPGKAKSFMHLSNIYYKLGKFRETESYMVKALEIFKKYNDLPNYLDSLFQYASLLIFLGNSQKAMQLLDECLQGASTIGNLELIANITGVKGNIHKNNGDLNKAMENFNKALEINTRLGNYSGQAMGLGAIGDLYLLTGNYDQAMAYLKEAYFLCKRVGNLKGSAQIALKFGAYFKSKGDMQKAIEHYNIAYNTYAQSNDKVNILEALTLLSAIYLDNGNLVEAEKYGLNAIKLAKELDNKPKIVDNLLKLGIFYARSNRFDLAEKNFQESLTIADQIGLKKGRAQIQIYQGDIKQAQGKLNEAMELYKEAYKLIEALDEPLIKAQALEAMGITYQISKDFKNAFACFVETNKQFQKAGNALGMANVTLNCGLMCMELHDYKKALIYLTDAKSTFERFQIKPQVERVNVLLNNLQQETNKPSK